MNLADFDFDLPPELIAQTPPEPRGSSRLMVLDRRTGRTEVTGFGALSDWLQPGDLLVVNDTRVFPARLLGRRVPSGGAVECLLLERLHAEPAGGPLETPTRISPPLAHAETWQALMHPGQKLRPGSRVVFEGTGTTIEGEVLARHHFGRRTIRLWTRDGSSLDAAIDALGHVPLPPYIKRDDDVRDRERYQTMFAAERGSVAAPTAGLHFTPAHIERLTARGVELARVTLHVGYGTFKPMRSEVVEDHVIDPEAYDIEPATADCLNRQLDDGRRVIAVGTTTTRALETAALAGGGRVAAGPSVSRLFIYPGFVFQVVGGLLTNFHLPRSSLLVLVAAFAGREQVLDAYRRAVQERMRFYSYGDAMLVI